MTNSKTSFPIMLDQETAVTIGKGHALENKVVVSVKNSTGAEARLRLSLQVKCGASPDALLASRDTPVKFECEISYGSEPIGCEEADTDEQGIRKWETRSKGIKIKEGAAITLSLTQFESNTPPGEASLTVGVRVYQNNCWEDIMDVPEVSVKKVAEEKDAPTIHYFNVSPDYILHAGEQKVDVSCYATGYTSLVLYKNNIQVRVWKPEGTPPAISGTYNNSPSITSVYRLEAFLSEADRAAAGEAANKPDKIEQRTVQVVSPGWNRIALPQGCPTRLFVSNDFSTGRGDRLYGIFVKADGQAGLYSSATGVDSWRSEHGNRGFPQDNMKKSPGVAYKNKLWLIGGSSVDPKQTSNEVWCYEKDESIDVHKWQKKETELNGMPTRMGHGCIVFNNKIFILGGMSKTKALNDVWSGVEDENTGAINWTCITSSAGWKPRCMFAATAFKGKIYIYGGVDDPYSVKRKNDLWSSADGENWTDEQDNFGIKPSPGDPVGATLVVQEDSLYLIGSFAESESNTISSFMFKLYADQKKWEKNPVPWPWEQYWGQTYAMECVAFNRFLFLFSLYSKMDVKSRLNVFIQP